MIPQAIEVEPTKGCRICGQTDGSDTLTAYILCLEHRQLAVHAPVLLAALEAQGTYLSVLAADGSPCLDNPRWHAKGCSSARSDSIACLPRCETARAAIAAVEEQG